MHHIQIYRSNSSILSTKNQLFSEFRILHYWGKTWPEHKLIVGTTIVYCTGTNQWICLTWCKDAMCVCGNTCYMMEKMNRGRSKNVLAVLRVLCPAWCKLPFSLQPNELVQVETYLRSEGVLVRFWYPLEVLEKPQQGLRKSSITGGQTMDTSSLHIHRLVGSCLHSMRAG